MPSRPHRRVRDRSHDNGDRPDGTTTREAFTANPSPPIDCFYVYPTVSMDPPPNSDMTAGNEERNVIRQQFARFRSQCRTSRRSTGRSPSAA